MSDQIIAASLSLNGEQANQTLKSFKFELKAAENSLLSISDKFGSTSKEAVEAAKKVANMRDNLGEAKSLVDAFNPDRKFNAFGTAVQGVAGGVSSLTGLMGLLGEGTEDTQKMMMKLQSAMAFSQGINQVLELKDTFKQLGAFIQSTTLYQKANAAATKAASVVQKLFAGSVDQTSTSFKFLKGAIAATGIGLLVLGIGEVVSALQSWTNAAEEAAEAQQRLAEKNKILNDAELKGALESSARFEKLETSRAQAAGASEEKLFKIREKVQQERIKSYEKYRDQTNQVDAESYKAAQDQVKVAYEDLQIMRLDFQKKEKEQQQQHNKQLADQRKQEYEKAKQAAIDAEQTLQKLRDENFLNSISDESKREEERIKLEANYERRQYEALKVSSDKKQQLIDEVNKKEQLALNALAEKNRKEFEEREKQGAEMLKQIKDQNYLIAIADEKERQRAKIEQDYLNSQAEIEALEITEDQKTAILKEIKIKRDADLKAIDDELAAQRAEVIGGIDDEGKSSFELEMEKLNSEFQTKMEIVKGHLDEELKVTQWYEQQKTALIKFQQEQRLSIVSGILGKAADLLGKQTAAGKALAISEAVINTYTGATAALRSKVPFPEPVATGIRIAQAALIIGAGLKSVHEIAKTKVPGGGGVSVPSMSFPSMGNTSAPLTPQVSSTRLDQDSLNSIGNAAIQLPQRAFVLESDVSDNQERITMLNRAARLGG
jgi:hypothetical protein